MRNDAVDPGESWWQWQGMEQLSRVALELVFAWLGGAELARAGAVCRAWRQIAGSPVLWRRLLAAHAPLSRSAQLALLNTDKAGWRQLYVESVAGWKAVGELHSPGGLLHAALSPCGRRLALLSGDVTVSIWETREEGGEWVERWGECLQGRGWVTAERGEWAAGGTRLLVAGTKALLHHDSWELLVVHEAADRGGWAGGARARASAGAAGCWADSTGEAFLSFELRSLAPGLAATTVWLNAATQEMQSEYAGVTTPLLRMFNGSGHLLRAVVAEVPLEDDPRERDTNDDEAYARATRTARGPMQLRVVVCLSGRRGEGAVTSWVLMERRPPPLVASAAGDLRARLLRRRAALAAPPPPEHEPTEAEVRALCTPPDATCPLPARPTGIVMHPNGRCAWVCWTGGGAACLSLPTLRPLRAVAPLAAPAALSSALDHYAQPGVSLQYFAAPGGGMSGAVHVWSVPVRGRHLDGAPVALRHRDAALAALLPPPHLCRPSSLLVLTSHAVHVWRSTATLQPDFHT